MTEEKKEQETTTKTALIELYNLKKDEHKDSPENLLKYATEVIKNSLPIFVSKTNSAWEHAKESKPEIKDFYKEAVAPDLATILNTDVDTAKKILNREVGKLFKNLNGSPYGGGKKAFNYFLADLLKGTDENNYNCPLFSATENPTSVIFPVSTFSIIAGRPSTGKTTALVSIAMQVVRDTEKQVLYMTTEETKSQLILRFIKNQFCYNCLMNNTPEYLNLITNEYNSSYITKSFKDAIREAQKGTQQELIKTKDKKPSFQKEVYKAAREVEDFITSERLQILDLVETQSFEDLEDALREQNQYTVVLLDYIQNLPYGAISNLDGTASAFREDIRKSTQVINNIIKTHDLIGIAGAQFNRQGANENNPEPLDLSNLGDSGSLERVAHIAIGLGRRNAKGNTKEKEYYYSVLKDREGITTGYQFKLVSNYYGYSYTTPDKTIDGLQNNIDAKQETNNNPPKNTENREKPKSIQDIIRPF